MSTVEYLQIAVCSLPLVGALICLVLLPSGKGKGNDNSNSNGNSDTKPVRYMKWFFATAALIWLGVIFYIHSYTLFTVYYPVFYISLLLSNVFLYNFTFVVTRIDPKKAFRKAHYFIPIVVILIAYVVTFFVPLDIRKEIVTSRGTLPEEYKWLMALYSYPLSVSLISVVYYSIKSLIRIRNYRKVIADYSANIEKSSLDWLLWMYILIFITTLPFPLAFFIAGKSILTPLLAILPAIILLVSQYTLGCYSVIEGKYVVINEGMEVDGKIVMEQQLTRVKFERYIEEKKPYLDSNLKITDIASYFNTNRTYISQLISSEYRMNFSRYTNLLRLKELEMLRADQANTEESSMELVLKAGFGSYRSYLRFRKAEEERARPMMK